MAGGPSKVKQPDSHPANPIHKQATEAQGLAEKKKTCTNTSYKFYFSNTTATKTTTTEPVDSQHVNKALVVMWLSLLPFLFFL